MQCTVVDNKELNREVFGLSLQSESKFSFQAGQAVKISIPDPEDPNQQLDRYFSIASPPESDEIELCIKEVGKGTSFLRNLSIGGTLEIEGPIGSFVYEPNAERNCVFLSMGTGVAPFRSMVLSQLFRASRPKSTLFVAGYRTAGDVLYEDELGSLDYLKYLPAISQVNGKQVGFSGRVTDFLKLSQEIAWGNTEFYVCGSAELVKDVREILMSKDISEDAIHHEPYLYPKKKS